VRQQKNFTFQIKLLMSDAFHTGVTDGKKAKSTRQTPPWTKGDEQELRKHSRSKSPLNSIAKAMKRTPGAVRIKGVRLGLPLGHRR
jgi:hypothetical protein